MEFYCMGYLSTVLERECNVLQLLGTILAMTTLTLLNNTSYPTWQQGGDKVNLIIRKGNISLNKIICIHMVHDHWKKGQIKYYINIKKHFKKYKNIKGYNIYFF